MPRRGAASLLLQAYGGASAEEAMRAAVDRLLEEAEVNRPPAPLDVLGSLRGVTDIEAVAMASAGRLVPLPDAGYIVQVNDADSRGRQRFSAAHEICHTFFNEARRGVRGHDDADIGVFDERRSEEFLCDVGAAHMLLHPPWLQDLAAGREPSLGCLFEAATRCDASAEATARQLAALGVWRCSFVFWEPGYRKGERELLARTPLSGLEAVAPQPLPKLRAARVYASPGSPFFPLRKSVDADSSIAAAALNDARTRRVERFDLGSQRLVVDCESQYAGYTDGDGRQVLRVLTLMRWLEER